MKTVLGRILHIYQPGCPTLQSSLLKKWETWNPPVGHEALEMALRESEAISSSAAGFPG